MKRIFYHILLPIFLPVLFFRIAATPVEVLGCRTRGLMAMAVALVSGLAALATAIVSAKARARKDFYTLWWILTSVILAVPVVAFLILA